MKYKYVTWIPAFILMCIIFLFSSKTATVSDQSSLQIASVIYNIYENTSDTVIENHERDQILGLINHITRKMAHGLEYCVLAIFVSLHLYACGKVKWKLFISSIIFSSFYAATDEFHQTFVAGRSGQVSDVLIDTMGATIGVIIFMLLCKRIRNDSVDSRNS